MSLSKLLKHTTHHTFSLWWIALPSKLVKVDEFTYLESTISSKLSVDKEIDRLIGKAASTLSRLGTRLCVWKKQLTQGRRINSFPMKILIYRFFPYKIFFEILPYFIRRTCPSLRWRSIVNIVGSPHQITASLFDVLLVHDIPISFIRECIRKEFILRSWVTWFFSNTRVPRRERV